MHVESVLSYALWHRVTEHIVSNFLKGNKMYTTRRGGFDRDDARLHYAQLQQRKTVPRVGDKVVMSDNKDACVYTVSETFQRGTAIMVVLVYPGLDGVMRNGGTVDASLLMVPTVQQTEKECV
jgi:hypothetical protein